MGAPLAELRERMPALPEPRTHGCPDHPGRRTAAGHAGAPHAWVPRARLAGRGAGAL